MRRREILNPKGNLLKIRISDSFGVDPEEVEKYSIELIADLVFGKATIEDMIDGEKFDAMGRKLGVIEIVQHFQSRKEGVPSDEFMMAVLTYIDAYQYMESFKKTA